MQRPPRDPREPLFSLQMLGREPAARRLGAGVGVRSRTGGRSSNGLAGGEARSFGFAAIVFGNLAMIHATRSRDRVFFAALRDPEPGAVVDHRRHAGRAGRVRSTSP